MGRPKHAYQHLPPYVKARRSGDHFIYYYQRHGRQIPLGTDYSNAEERATAAMAVPPPDALNVADEATIIAKAVPASSVSGIYFLILDGRISYVGQSRNVWRRLSQHMKERRFDAYSWIACPPSDLDRMEEHCILKFKPWQNGRFNPNFRTVPKKALASN